MKNSRKAFTLVELLVVVAVLALLASIVFSNLMGAREGARIANSLQYESSMHRLLGGDLVGKWNFNDPGARYSDASSYGNHGLCSSCPTVVDGVPGTMGSAMNFNGTNNAIETPSSPQFDFRGGSLTISSWAKSDFASFGRIINQYATISLDTGGAFVHLSGSSSSAVWSAYGGLTANSWNHLVMTFDGASAKLTTYKDGERCTESIGSGQIERYYGNFWIGSGGADWNQAYGGIIDDVRVYSRTLTAQEIQTLYAEAKGKYLTNE